MGIVTMITTAYRYHDYCSREESSAQFPKMVSHESSVQKIQAKVKTNRNTPNQLSQTFETRKKRDRQAEQRASVF
jgi:hypothetical protein